MSRTQTARTALLESASAAAGVSLDIAIHPADLQRQLVKFARSDLRFAAREGSCIVAQTRVGNVQLERQSDDSILVSCERGEIARGTVMQLAPIVAGLFRV